MFLEGPGLLIFFYDFWIGELIGLVSATKNSFEGVLKTLEKPGGGEFGKYYSLPALNDSRIGEAFL